MCDEITEADNATHLTRRQLGASAGAVGMAALLPTSADAKPVKGRDVTITTPDGQCDAYFTAPASGKHPGVLMWPDIMGLRPAFRQMADRLAGEGYAVLVVNQFYRSTKSPIVQPGESFDQPAVRDKIMPWRAALTADAVTRGGTTFVAFLEKQKEVDTKRPIGSAGYCMGGPMVLRAAATRADRIGAGATFHGGGLTTKNPDSPHLSIAQSKASYLIAIAENDDKSDPTSKDILRKTFDEAKRPAEIEVYPAQHGWCAIDSQVYNKDQAEKAWARKIELYKKALA